MPVFEIKLQLKSIDNRLDALGSLEAGVVHERRDIVLLHRLAVGCPHPTRSTAAIVVSRRCFIDTSEPQQSS